MYETYLRTEIESSSMIFIYKCENCGKEIRIKTMTPPVHTLCNDCKHKREYEAQKKRKADIIKAAKKDILKNIDISLSGIKKENCLTLNGVDYIPVEHVKKELMKIIKEK